MPNLPQVIILYGPPGAGKGTQAEKLKSMLPDYRHIDFGTQLRKFIIKHLGNYSKDELVENPNSSPEQIAIAKSLRIDMLDSLPAKSGDLRYVVEQVIIDSVQNNQGMIIEGPGRIEEEAQWLSDFFNKQEVSVGIFHLHITKEEAIRRSTKRYYIPDSKVPYPSYEAAKVDCKEGQEPFQRPEDTDSLSITRRYRMLYSDYFARIISIYQLNAGALVMTLDASKDVEHVAKDINDYLKKFFDYSF